MFGDIDFGFPLCSKLFDLVSDEEDVVDEEKNA